VELNNERIGMTKKVAFVYENVTGMAKDIKEEITSWLEVVPAQMNADHVRSSAVASDATEGAHQ
jgi:hypothetical protein